jgi:hypothetical protein
MFLSAAPAVAGLIGYLMSLPSVRNELNLDKQSDKTDWAARVKSKVVQLAQAAKTRFNSDLLIANNGAAELLSCNKPVTRKRDNIPGLPQATTTVCFLDPFQCLRQY